MTRRQRHYGSGPECPDDPGHGPLIRLDGRRYWCPHSDHDRPDPANPRAARRPRIWPEEEVL